MKVILSQALVQEFKIHGNKGLSGVAAFHAAQGNFETVEAVEAAAHATNSL